MRLQFQFETNTRALDSSQFPHYFSLLYDATLLRTKIIKKNESFDHHRGKRSLKFHFFTVDATNDGNKEQREMTIESETML